MRGGRLQAFPACTGHAFLDINAPIDFGRLDSLVANAGIGMYGGLEDGSDDDLTRTVEVNFSARRQSGWVMR
jgi:NAD(P)-dependent dehydrogenase (short-subunit alcohol dehydrogenase family)